MAFENIEVGSLKSALIECKNSLKYDTSNSLKETILNSSVWQCRAQGNLKNALIKLTEERYKELEDKIESYIGITSLIEKYKKLEEKNKELQAKNDELSKHLYRKVKKYFLNIEYYEDELDFAVLDEINANKEIIRKNKEEMDNIEKRVLGSI